MADVKYGLPRYVPSARVRLSNSARNSAVEYEHTKAARNHIAFDDDGS